MDAVALDVLFIGLTGNSRGLNEALSLPVGEPSCHTLVAVLGDEVIKVAVSCGTDTGSKTESGSFLAASKGTNNQHTFSVFDGHVGVGARFAVSSETVLGLAEGRDLSAEDTEA